MATVFFALLKGCLCTLLVGVVSAMWRSDGCCALFRFNTVASSQLVGGTWYLNTADLVQFVRASACAESGAESGP